MDITEIGKSDRDIKIVNTLKYSGLFFIISAVLIILLGLSTYLWKPIDAQVSYYSKNNICIGGYSNVSHPRVQQIKSGICNYISIDYHYTLHQKLYSKKFIGFYLPINVYLELVEPYKKITVYYLPFFPDVSVIKRGVGFGLTSILFFIGYFCLLVRKKLLNLSTEKYSNTTD